MRIGRFDRGSWHLSLNDADGVMIEIIQLTEGLYLMLLFAYLEAFVGHQDLKICSGPLVAGVAGCRRLKFVDSGAQ